MCGVDKGRLNGCKDNIGGVKELYLYSYNKPSYIDNVVIDNTLVQTITDTVIYRYNTNEVNFNEDVQINEDGEVYNQSLNATIPYFDWEVMNYTGRLVIAIIKDYKNRYRVIGLNNGAEINVSATSGGTFTDRNGLSLDIKGTELSTAPYLTDLNAVGYIIDGVITNDYLFQNSNSFIFQDGNNYIFN